MQTGHGLFPLANIGPYIRLEINQYIGTVQGTKDHGCFETYKDEYYLWIKLLWTILLLLYLSFMNDYLSCCKIKCVFFI